MPRLDDEWKREAATTRVELLVLLSCVLVTLLGVLAVFWWMTPALT